MSGKEKKVRPCDYMDINDYYAEMRGQIAYTWIAFTFEELRHKKVGRTTLV